MNIRALAVLGCSVVALFAGCKSPDGRKPPGTRLPHVARSPEMFVTREVYQNPRPNEPGKVEYQSDDLTYGGTTPGRELQIGEQIVRRPGTAYRVRASYAANARCSRRICCRYDALVAPTPPFQTSALATATFESGSLKVHIEDGWAYVSGDMPVTDTGVVQTSTLGSQASGEWISHELPGGKLHVTYNLGKGSTSALEITLRGVIQDRKLRAGEKFEFDELTGGTTWSRYDPHEAFLEEVVKIAAAAGIAIVP